MDQEQSKRIYHQRIHAVQDYIDQHITEPITIAELANAAGFSVYHFERIFKSIVHEPLFRYVNRIKLERAAYHLIYRRDMTVTDISGYLGFTDSAVFSRTFKNYYHMSPTAYREHFSKNCKDLLKISFYNEEISECNKKLNQVNGQIEVVSRKDRMVAYLRYTGSYRNLSEWYPKSFDQLMDFVQENHLYPDGELPFLSIYHDNPAFTIPDQLRTSVGILLPDGFNIKAEEHIQYMMLPGGKYVVGHFYLPSDEYSDAWDYMYEEWMTNSGYQPKDALPFEIYRNNPSTDPLRKSRVDIYLPIIPLI